MVLARREVLPCPEYSTHNVLPQDSFYRVHLPLTLLLMMDLPSLPTYTASAHTKGREGKTLFLPLAFFWASPHLSVFAVNVSATAAKKWVRLISHFFCCAKKEVCVGGGKSSAAAVVVSFCIFLPSCLK